eukprot:scaffold1.g5749.t1
MLSSQAAARALRTPAAARALAGASRRLHSAPCALKDGEDVAREHLGAENEPQIQKQTSEQGADETAGEGAAEDAADEAEEQAMGRDLQKAEGWDPWAQRALGLRSIRILARGLTTGDSLGFEALAAGEGAKGRSFLITGATSGIGRHTAEVLAAAGGTVFLHGRSLARVKRTLRELRANTGSQVFGYCYDLSTVQGVHDFAAHVWQDMERVHAGIDVLINNAGVFEEDHHVTPDGLERTWAVNVAAPFLLTAELLPLVGQRIVQVSSISMPDRLDWENLQCERGYEREGHAAYGASKLALNMWSYLLSEKLAAAGAPHSVVCVDPGCVSTKILFQARRGQGGGLRTALRCCVLRCGTWAHAWARGWGEIASEVAARPGEAEDVAWAALAPGLRSGEYLVNRRPRRSPAFSYDRAEQERLWGLLEKQTGVQWGLG